MNNEILKPDRIKQNSRIALITPSSFIKKEKLNTAILNINNLGMQIVQVCRENDRFGYLAGTDEQRIENIHYCFSPKNLIDGVFCVRGGFGATRLLENIDYELIHQNPLLFVGFSDITALQSAFFIKSGLASLHGIVGASEFTPYILKQINDLVINPVDNYKLPATTFEILNHGEAEGTIVGGNLSLLAAMAGTQYLYKFKRNIVFIEDVGEPPYKIDRMIVHLLQATDLKEAAAIVFGTFNECEPENHGIERENSFLVDEVIKQHFKKLRIPVVYNLNFGHIKNMLIFPIGIKAHLETKNFSITLLEKLVK